MANLVLTVIGDDRRGLVDALSGVVVEHGGNWDRSHLARMEGKFAGIVLVSVADDVVDTFVADLHALDGMLEITVGRADSPSLAAGRLITVKLLGNDRAGIVHEVSHTLAERGVSIEELETSTREAPMAGGILFQATLQLLVPSDVSSDEVVDDLEGLSSELMVEIQVNHGPPK